VDRWSREPYDDPTELRGLRIIGTAVRRKRRGSGISQVQLAYWTSLNQSTISRLETARLRSMRLRVLARILGVLLAPPEYLVDGPNPPTRRLPVESRYDEDETNEDETNEDETR